jgi:hypothetical protein
MRQNGMPTGHESSSGDSDGFLPLDPSVEACF